MKIILLFFAMLASMTASAAVTVTPLNVNYDTKTVTFRVSWTGTAYNNRVWVWVDFCSVSGITPDSFSPATITGATITGGNGSTNTLNGRGFFIEYDATNTGTTVTAALSNAPAGKFNWCVYGSDYPPNVLANTNGSYTLAGTPPFKLIASNGSTTQTVDGNTIATSALTITPATITDATGYPGLWCPYTGSDLYMDAAHRCSQRQSGAYNWEAYIKDSRDNQIYRITQFSDNTWWFADDLAIDANTYGICNGVHFYRGSSKPACPTGWQIPTEALFKQRWPSYCGNTTFPPLSDTYGAPIPGTCYYGNVCGGSAKSCINCNGRSDYLVADKVSSMLHRTEGGCGWNCNQVNVDTGIGGRVRCKR